MALVAGVDSSTQACKVLVCDATTGRVVRHGRAPHPDGTEVDPEAWWAALQSAVSEAGGLDDVEAIAIGGQQHGMVCLDEDGKVIRPALLWNDTRSADAARDLVVELGGGDARRGAEAWAQAVGSVPVASFTVTKLRWLAEHEPQHARRVAAVALPHDWLSWRLTGSHSLDDLRTDRSDASGTGYFDAATGRYRRDLLARALGRASADGVALPAVLGPRDVLGYGDHTAGLAHLVVGPGCGDNAGAALGLGLRPGSVFVSIGTSGVVAAVSRGPTADPSGEVAGFADATGHHLPLACTLNGSRVLDSTAALLGVDHARLSELALTAEPGAQGLVLVPYLEGERTPNLPHATGSLHGLTLSSFTPQNVARAAVEGLLCLLADCLEAIRRQGVAVEEVRLVGGAARSHAVQVLAPALLGVPVQVPDPGEYVALGAARQAAWMLAGGAVPPRGGLPGSTLHEAAPDRETLQRYRAATADVIAGLRDRD
ncbi:MAG TPA: xylulokinase [Marmoricola sp.]